VSDGKNKLFSVTADPITRCCVSDSARRAPATARRSGSSRRSTTTRAPAHDQESQAIYGVNVYNQHAESLPAAGHRRHSHVQHRRLPVCARPPRSLQRGCRLRGRRVLRHVLVRESSSVRSRSWPPFARRTRTAPPAIPAVTRGRSSRRIGAQDLSWRVHRPTRFISGETTRTPRLLGNDEEPGKDSAQDVWGVRASGSVGNAHAPPGSQACRRQRDRDLRLRNVPQTRTSTDSSGAGSPSPVRRTIARRTDSGALAIGEAATTRQAQIAVTAQGTNAVTGPHRVLAAHRTLGRGRSRVPAGAADAVDREPVVRARWARPRAAICSAQRAWEVPARAQRLFEGVLLEPPGLHDAS